MTLCPSCSLFELGTLLGHPSSRHGSWTFTLQGSALLLEEVASECAGCAFFKAVVASKFRTSLKTPGLIILRGDASLERNVKKIRLYQTHASFMDMAVFYDDLSRDFDTFTVIRVGGELFSPRCYFLL